MAKSKGGPLRADWKFNSRLKEVLSQIRKNLGGEITSLGEDAVEIAKGILPPKDITYEYEQSIRMENGEFDSKKFKSDQPGAHLEFGTNDQRAYPHMIPAVRIAKRNAKDRMAGGSLLG